MRWLGEEIRVEQFSALLDDALQVSLSSMFFVGNGVPFKNILVREKRQHELIFAVRDL